MWGFFTCHLYVCVGEGGGGGGGGEASERKELYSNLTAVISLYHMLTSIAWCSTFQKMKTVILC